MATLSAGERAAIERRLAELDAMDAAEKKATAPKPKAKEETYDPTEGMSGFQKAAASVGAGVNSLWTGAKQRYTQAFGTDEENAAMQDEIAAERARDEKLFDKTKGGRVLQAVGQAAPLLLLPGGQGAAARIVLGAAGGALGGALQPTLGDESAIKNTVVGGVLGGALPGAMAAWRGARPVVGAGAAREAAAQGLTERVAQDAPRLGARASAAETEQAARALARDLDQTLTAGGNLNGIRMSAAQQSGNRALGEAELLSRQKYRGAWNEFDTAQAREIADSVRGATREADDLDRLMANRRANYTANWQGVSDAIDQGVYADQRAALRQHMEQLLNTPEGLQPSVEQTLRRFLRQMDDAGENFTPAHLKELRAQLSGKSNPGMAATDPARAAPRDNPAIIALKQRMDSALDEASGGAWTQQVVTPYRLASNDVRAAQAAQNVRDRFFNPQTGLAQTTAADLVGEVPTITQAGLRNALAGATNARTGQTLLRADSHEALQRTMEALRRKEWAQQIKKSGTAGGGSDTAANLYQMAQDQATREILGQIGSAGGAPGRVLLSTLRAAGNVGTMRRTAAEMAALQSPEAMAEIMRQAAAQLGRQPTQAEAQAIMQSILQGASNVGANAARQAPGVMASQYAARP